jgi:hypothetical protein
MSKKLTTKEFIDKCILIHGDKYDYSITNYIKNNERVSINCKIHGEFKQIAGNHIKGQGCPSCGLISSSKTRKTSTENLIGKFNLIHDDKYDYSLVEYINSKTKIKIICPTHGEFEQIPHSHLKGNGCVKCSGEQKTINQSSNTNEFIHKAKNIHGHKYDYSLVNYKTNHDKIKIICPEHGEFEQIPNSHLKGRGCPTCGSKIKGGWTTTNWLEKSEKSKVFDSFKFYVIECYNDNERFIKIGRTFKTVKKRFSGKIPYNYILLKEIVFDTHNDAFEFEVKIKALIKEFQYTPKLEFGGRFECYNIEYKNTILSKV